MASSILILVGITVCIALLFDFINGFHDAANSIATIVSTRVLRPGTAVIIAAFCNFFAMLIFVPKVAHTISQIVKVTPHDLVYVYVVLAGLMGAITWGLATWLIGFPTSSSHALIGGFAGAGIANGGWEAINWDKLYVALQFIFIAPLLGMSFGYLLMGVMSWTFHRVQRSMANAFFRKGQLLSCILYSLGHGGNDGQKTMGIILALLIAAGSLPSETSLSLRDKETAWIILSCQAVLGCGTAFGGWKIVKTMGFRIAKLKPINGFCAEFAGAFTLFLSTFSGIPVSTTHTITGSIMGVGSASRGIKRVRWRLAFHIILSWFLTIPFCGLIAASFFYLVNLFY